MEVIKNAEFGGERPLFASHNLRLENVVIHAGESAIKRSSNIEAVNCRFEGKYPFWHVDDFVIKHCVFAPGARAALWYSTNVDMSDTLVEAPKMFREMRGIKLTRVRIPDAAETLWHVHDVTIRDVEVHGADYLFMHSSNIDIENYRQQGNYSFQYCRNVTIRNAVIDSKDAFWNTENVTLINCEITGEYLGWHSKGLRLNECKISGTQPLCYCNDLVVTDCEFTDECDLAFEESTLNAEIKGHVRSVKNPTSGVIRAGSIGEIIIDDNVRWPGDCKIIETDSEA